MLSLGSSLELEACPATLFPGEPPGFGTTKPSIPGNLDRPPRGALWELEFLGGAPADGRAGGEDYNSQQHLRTSPASASPSWLEGLLLLLLKG